MSASNQFRVRMATADDIVRIVDFQIAMAWESEHLKLDPDILRTGVKRVFEDSRWGFYIVAEDLSGQVIASTLVQYEWSDWRSGEVWWIHSVYVAPDFRRLGVFRAIYAEIKQRAADREDVRGLRLYVERENQKAQATYVALGMNADRYHLYEWMKTF